MSNTAIGYIISWQVPSSVPLADLRAGVTAIGLDAIDLVPDLNSASLVARSAGLVARTMSGKDTKRLARKVEHSKRQITAELHDAAGLTYSRDFAVEYDETTKHVVQTDGGIALGTVRTDARDRDTARDRRDPRHPAHRRE
jgi:hypothetical protein